MWEDTLRQYKYPVPYQTSTTNFEGIKTIFYVYLFLRESACTRAGGARAETERGTEDMKRALCWHQQARCGGWNHEITNHEITIWASRMPNGLSHASTNGIKILNPVTWHSGRMHYSHILSISETDKVYGTSMWASQRHGSWFPHTCWVPGRLRLLGGCAPPLWQVTPPQDMK